MSNYQTQYEEEQAQAELLKNQEFYPVNVNQESNGSGKKITFRKVTDVLRAVVNGLDAGTMYSTGGYPGYNTYNQSYTNQTAMATGNSNNTLMIVGSLVLVGGVLWAANKGK